MRLMSYNILDGGLGRADPIGEILQANRPDVVTLIEADDMWVAERLAKRLKMEMLVAQGKKHTAIVLSRFPIRESVNHAPLLESLTGCFVRALVTLPSGSELGVCAGHLHPRARISDEQVRVREVEAITGVLAQWREQRRPHLVAGDLNANSPIQRIIRERCKQSTREQMDENGGMIPRDVIGHMLSAGYVDTLHAVHGDKAADMGTFSTHEPGQRVDYIFGFGIDTARIRNAWIETDRLAKYASDHYPVGVEIGATR